MNYKALLTRTFFSILMIAVTLFSVILQRQHIFPNEISDSSEISDFFIESDVEVSEPEIAEEIVPVSAEPPVNIQPKKTAPVPKNFVKPIEKEEIPENINYETTSTVKPKKSHNLRQSRRLE